MEFLMTYGWAVLIMLTVVAVLFYLGIFSPGTVSPNSCVMPPGFSCYGFVLYEGGSLNLDLGQSTGKGARITRIACTAAEDPVGWTDFNRLLQSGRHYSFEGITCTQDDGVNLPAEGEYYRGYIFIEYVEEDTDIPHRIVGDIAYKVEEDVS